MAPRFGTSGLRGLAAELTSDLIGDYVSAFLTVCPTGHRLFVGRDLRDSSPKIMQDVITRARRHGVNVYDCGALATPALAMAALSAKAGAIMVTGSHIPANRNGLKFFTQSGEITKAEELAITGALAARPTVGAIGTCRPHDATQPFIDRYIAAFGQTALAGRHIGLWAHSAVARDMLQTTLQALGARVTQVGRTGHFVTLDTEALSDDAQAFLTDQAQQHAFDAIVSTDADGDRPLVTDHCGALVPGDILGQITAQELGADTVVTTLTANTGLEKCQAFRNVIRTKIGSPHVISGMTSAPGNVVGYEPNGGFLLGFDAKGPAGVLPALWTRDSHLPIIMTLVAAGEKRLADHVAKVTTRHTASTRLQDVPSAWSDAFIGRMAHDPIARASFLASLQTGPEHCADTTDGLRITLASGQIVHIRPSGNAPELRIYTEAETAQIARSLRSAASTALTTLLVR